MFQYLFPIGLVVVSNVLYHILLKVTPGNVNPALTLAVTYVTSALSCLILLPFFPHTTSLAQSVKQLNWTSAALGIVIVGLEMGILLAYRIGWKISLAGIVSATCVGLILIPIGLSFFKEKLTIVNLLGILVCITGLIMINRN
jgi:uncharacterized membrane protein